MQLSSKVIPGNEIGIRDIQNMLIRKGFELITLDTEANIHLSGHDNRDMVKNLYEWLHPNRLMPVHGDASMYTLDKNSPKFEEFQKFWSLNLRYSNGELQKIDYRDLVFNAIDSGGIIPLNSFPLHDSSAMSYN